MTRRKPDSSTQAERGRKGKAASPWSKGPNSGTYSAGLSYLRYVKNKTNPRGK